MKTYQAPVMVLSNVNAEDILTLSNGKSGTGESGDFRNWVQKL